MSVRVAAVQFCPEFGKKSANLRRLVGLVVDAARGGAKIVVLPELAATGYSFMSKEAAAVHAEVIFSRGVNKSVGDSVDVMAALSKRLNVVIAWGLVERDDGTGEIYNSQALVTPQGQIVSYRKINPWAQDFLWAVPGRNNPPVISLEFDGETRKVGLLICRDVRDRKDDSWSDFYEKGDADIVCFSSNFGKGGFPAVAWMDFVTDNGGALVVSNRYGTELNNDFGPGGICIIDKNSKVHCDGLVWNQDCIVYADL